MEEVKLESKLEKRHAIPTGLQILLSELNFLSQIKRNTKPCCTDHVLVDSTSWSGAFYRFYKGENRNNSISKIEQIVSQTIDAIETHKNTDHIKIIINYFSDAREGVNSLLTVYSDDPDIKARIKVQLDIIDLQLDRFRHLIKGFRKEEDSVAERNVDKNFEKSTEKNVDKNVDKYDESFPGLNTANTNTAAIDLFDPDSEKKRQRKNRIKQSLDKTD